MLPTATLSYTLEILNYLKDNNYWQFYNFIETKLCTIFAHARYINSLSTMGNRIVSSGEDGYFRVWELSDINGKLKVK